VIDMLDDANDTVPSPSNNTLPAPIVAVDDDTDKPDVPENTTLDDAPRTDMVDCADDTEIVDAVSTDKLPDVAAVPTSNLPCGNEMLDEMMLMLPLATLIAPLPVTEIGVLVIDTEAPALLTKITPPFCVTVAPVNETLEPAPPLSIVPPLRLSFVEPVTVNDVVSRNRAAPPEAMLMVLEVESTLSDDEPVKRVGEVTNVTFEALESEMAPVVERVGPERVNEEASIDTSAPLMVPVARVAEAPAVTDTAAEDNNENGPLSASDDPEPMTLTMAEEAMVLEALEAAVDNEPPLTMLMVEPEPESDSEPPVENDNDDWLIDTKPPPVTAIVPAELALRESRCRFDEADVSDKAPALVSDRPPDEMVTAPDEMVCAAVRVRSAAPETEIEAPAATVLACVMLR
jgi:hypothetical protein